MDEDLRTQNGKRRRQTMMRLMSARWQFFQTLSKNVHTQASHKSEQLKLLSSERCFQLAEFFAILHLHEIDETSKLATFIDAHNDGIADYEKQLQQDPASFGVFDISTQRLKRVRFSMKAKENACSLFEISSSFDQSDLARFVYHHMSEETCRKAVEGLAGMGLLTRRQLGSSMVVKSIGKLEQAYFAYLDKIEG